VFFYPIRMMPRREQYFTHRNAKIIAATVAGVSPFCELALLKCKQRVSPPAFDQKLASLVPCLQITAALRALQRALLR
jgi:hypothetical protein